MRRGRSAICEGSEDFVKLTGNARSLGERRWSFEKSSPAELKEGDEGESSVE